jgi:hypothetical protein
MIAGDPYYNYVKAALHFDSSLVDTSSNPKTFTAAGDATISTARSKFGGSSLFSSTGYVQCETSSDFVIAGDFTIECFFNYASLGAYSTLAGLGTYASGIMLRNELYVNGGVLFNGWLSDYTAANTWYHFAVVRQGSTVKIYINGVLKGTATYSGTINSTGNRIMLAASLHTGGGENWNGWIDDFRFTNGVARYTSDFTPPATAFLDNPQYYELPVTLTESIAPTQFKAVVSKIADGALVHTATLTAGDTTLLIPSAVPVMVTLLPNQGDIWKASTVYAVNDLVFPTNPISTPYYYKRIAAGTSSATTEPTWSTAVAGQCDDGSVTNAWERVARLTQPITHGPLIPS